ncbi:MAG TPA: hydantoinase/oxoprolinase family protein, partial [Actinomycetota bacterium]|nr:hydantoinase/oxoprolinase family protein [Actinomycetota bacterium]
DASSVERLVHGSTVVVNAIVQRSGPPTALVMTRGFADVLAIGRANRPDMYNFRYEKPVPYIDEELRFEVDERLDASGAVVRGLDAASLDELTRRVEASGAAAVAVCLLHAYANPVHERLVAERLRKELPAVAVSASHEISELWREYERASTTVLNAYTQPAVDTYLGELATLLDRRGFAGRLQLVTSSGGLTDTRDARAHPVMLVESGPVAGVAGCARLGAALGEADVLALDVGGTTAKAAAVRDGHVPITDDYAIARTHRFPGYPIQVPTVDVVEIGSGGGSLVRAAADGSVWVGPESAGASPGPACYGWGGAEPTVTDAALVSGWLDPTYFLGGRMPLHPEPAADALGRLGARIGLSTEATAAGALRLVHEGLAGALRLVTLEQGYDPRDFTLCASGGAGPMHAALVAREIGVGRVLVPPSPGIFSAWAMLLLEPRADASATRVVRLDEADGSIFEGLRARAEARLAVPAERESRAVSMRYRGQEHTLEVPYGDGLAQRFHAAHDERFGFSLPDAAIECVTFRLTVWGAPSEASLGQWPKHDVEGPRGHRRVSFGDEVGERVPVYRRDGLGAGVRLEGPAIVEEQTSTTLVPPDAEVEVDGHGNLLVEL